MLLIVGSGGLLGSHVAAYFLQAGMPVVCASHKPGADLKLDLAQPLGDFAKQLPKGITHVFVCSSITSLDACARDPETTRRFNVTHTIALLEQLLAKGIRPIFCSSDLVFKGDRGNYREDDPREPTTEYGRQKHTVEEFLLGQAQRSLIIRMSKLYSLAPDDPSPIGQMLTALKRGQCVRGADDQTICPTCVEDIPKALHALLNLRATGVYHVASSQRDTRYTLARRLAAAIGRERLVQRCSIRDFTFVEPRPTDNSLDVSRFLSATPCRFTTLDERLPEILRRRGTIDTSGGLDGQGNQSARPVPALQTAP
ncbi:MAG: SDR family oxidoreductase [Candidatus Omnitrophica bacterium]|nr:SDR family oxidoreductase [Candidatus Omnitrophota bacterium]